MEISFELHVFIAIAALGYGHRAAARNTALGHYCALAQGGVGNASWRGWGGHGLIGVFVAGSQQQGREQVDEKHGGLFMMGTGIGYDGPDGQRHETLQQARRHFLVSLPGQPSTRVLLPAIHYSK